MSNVIRNCWLGVQGPAGCHDSGLGHRTPPTTHCAGPRCRRRHDPWHLEHHHHIGVSRATIYRIIRRAGLVTAGPKKKPKSSYIRFQAEQPNETSQADFTHHRLADGTDIEILTWLDDHSRYALSPSPRDAHRNAPTHSDRFRVIID